MLGSKAKISLSACLPAGLCLVMQCVLNHQLLDAIAEGDKYMKSMSELLLGCVLNFAYRFSPRFLHKGFSLENIPNKFQISQFVHNTVP